MHNNNFIILCLISIAGGSYDEFLTCDKLNEARNARVLDDIPCDMQKQTYCEYKGFAYPEHAIWKFKEENRALMRRLYGDVDSNEVYREMRSNNLFDYETPSSRYSSSHQKTDRHTRDHGSATYSVNMVPFNENMFNGLHYNIRVGSGLAMVKNAKIEKLKKGGDNTNSDNTVPLSRSRTRGRTTKKTTARTTSTSTTVVTVQTSTSTSHSTTTSQPSTTTTEMPTTATTVQQPQTIQPTTTDFIPATATNEPQTVMAFGDTQYPTSQSTGTESDKLTESPTTESEPASSREGPVNFPTTINSEDYEDYELPSPASLEDEDLDEDLEYTQEEHDAIQESILEEQGEDIEELAAEIEMINEQEEEEFEEIIDYSGESIHACPVYEEVKAPFWANNTRNQVVALLNLYPFEQYIHMERCKDEGEQMLCRPGCRCEQQYRLHRLLAFDPKNECRGIFSDWFRFPSFCLCKCYNVPEQVLATMHRKSKGLPQTPVQKKIRKQKPKYSGPAHHTNLNNHRISKESKVFQDTSTLIHPEASIPAIFPYEGKAAIMNELNRQAAATAASNRAAATAASNRAAATAASNRAAATDASVREGPSSTIDSVGGMSGQAVVSDGFMPYQTALQQEAAERIMEATNQQFQLAAEEQLVDAAAKESVVVQDKMAATQQLLDMVEMTGEQIDNTVESNLDHFKKNSKEGRQLEDHFFYNNPIVEFKLPDGTSGSVATHPRR